MSFGDGSRLEIRPILLEAKNTFPVPLGILSLPCGASTAESVRPDADAGDGGGGGRFAYVAMPPSDEWPMLPTAALSADAMPSAPTQIM